MSEDMKKDGVLWGRKYEVVEDTTHITQCNENANETDAQNCAHVTDNIRGEKNKVGTYFDKLGNFKTIKYGGR